VTRRRRARVKDGIKAAIQPREADLRPGTRPDPELARRERLEREWIACHLNPPGNPLKAVVLCRSIEAVPIALFGAAPQRDAKALAGVMA
jgi:hypothetical protein